MVLGCDLKDAWVSIDRNSDALIIIGTKVVLASRIATRLSIVQAFQLMQASLRLVAIKFGNVG